MERKANKLVYAIAKKLVESQGCQVKISRHDLLQVFEDVIKGLPKKEPLKAELQKNIATYTNKLNRWVVKKQTALGKEMSRRTKEPQKEEISIPEYKFNLYADGGFLRAVEDMEKSQDSKLAPFLLALDTPLVDEDFEDRIAEVILKSLKKSRPTKKSQQQVEHLVKLYKKEMMILVGNHDNKRLLQCLNRFHQNLTAEVEYVIENENVDCGRKLQDFFLDFLGFARFQFEQFKHKEACVPSYEDLIAAIMALFIDLSVFLSRGQNKSPSHYGKKALYRLQLLLGHTPLSILYVLLQLTESGHQDADFMMPIYKKVLSQIGNETCPYYCSFVLTSRQACDILHDAYPQVCRNIIQTCLSMKVPTTILSWLSDKTAETVELFPVQVTRDVNKLTMYLLKEATQDLCEALLDGMSLLEESSVEEETDEEEDEQPLFFMDNSKNTQDLQDEECPLFITDMHSESESDDTKSLKRSIDSLILGLDSDGLKQDKSSDSDSSSQSEDDEVTHHVVPAKNKRQVAVSTSTRKKNRADQNIDQDEDEEHHQKDTGRTRQQAFNLKSKVNIRSRKRSAPAVQGEMKSENQEVEQSNDEEHDHDEEKRSGDAESDQEEHDEVHEKKQEVIEISSDEEQSDKHGTDESGQEIVNVRMNLQKSPRKTSTRQKVSQRVARHDAVSDQDVKKSPRKTTAGQREKGSVHTPRMRRSTRQKSKAGESASNEDESFMTCEDVDEKDVFYDADEDISFKISSLEKTPLSNRKSADNRNFLGTPKTYLRQSAQLTMSESKNNLNQTTLDKFFISQPLKSASSSSGGVVTNISDTQLSVSDGDEKQGELKSPRRVSRSAVEDTSEDKNCVTAKATRSHNKVTPNPTHQMLDQHGGSITPKLKNTSESAPKGVSRKLQLTRVEEEEGNESPVFVLTESQLSNSMTQAEAQVVPESDSSDLEEIKDNQLEDTVIQGIKEIRKSISPQQSPGRRSSTQKQGLMQQQHTEESKVNSLTPPSSPTPLVIINVTGNLVGSKCKPPIPKSSSRRSVKAAKTAEVSMKSLQHISDKEPTSPGTHRRSKRISESSEASELSMPRSPQRSQRLEQTSRRSHSSAKRKAFFNKTDTKESQSFPKTCPPRIRRSERTSESSAVSEHSNPTTFKRNLAQVQSTAKVSSTLLSPRKPSSQESGVYPLHSSLSSQRERSEPVSADPAGSPHNQTSPAMPDTGYERTLRSRTVSGDSCQEESIMDSQESLTATQFLRRDRDRRKLKYASLNDDDEEEVMIARPKKKRTSLRSEKKSR